MDDVCVKLGVTQFKREALAMLQQFQTKFSATLSAAQRAAMSYETSLHSCAAVAAAAKANKYMVNKALLCEMSSCTKKGRRQLTP